MKPIFYYVLTIVAFFLSTNWLFGQNGDGLSGSTEAEFARTSQINQQMVIPPSPEAASLGKYGDFQLNHYTGAASFSVPIYTIQGKGIQLPIALNYDASGNKVATRPGWVGLGWTLSAGGVITRSVIGNPDLLCNYYSKSAELAQTTEYADKFEENDFLYDVASGEIEGQPDQYYYSYPGGSGKFYIKPDESIVHKEWKSVEIETSFDDTGSGADYDIDDFVLKDQHGNRYYFEIIEETQLCLDDGAGSQSEFIRSICGTFCWDFTTTWHLSKIESRFETILFEYEEDLTDYDTPIHPYENKTESISFAGGPQPDVGEQCCGNSTQSSGEFWSSVDHSKVTNRHFLKKIIYKRAGVELEEVEFVTSSNTCTYAAPTARQLDKIIVRRGKVDAAQPMVREFVLSYQSNCTQKRLLLTKVQEQLADNTAVKPPYIFEYESTVFPSFASTKVDHWGYYNAQSNGNSMIPSITFSSYSYSGANRKPSSVMDAGILTSVTYPTKGYTEFDLEPHEAAGKGTVANYDPSANPNHDRMVGGLRVHAISHFNHDGTLLLKRSYQYVKAGQSPSSPTSSSGLVLSEPIYDQQTSFFHQEEPDMNPGGGTTCMNLTYTCNKTSITASNKSQLGSVQGNHIGYSRVEEIISSNDPNSTISSGKTVYIYHNDYDINLYDNHENGQLEKTEIYDDAGKKLSSKELFYSLESSANHTPEIRNSDFFYAIRAEAKAQQSNQVVLCKDTIAFTGGYGFITLFDSENPSNSGFNCTEEKIYRTQFQRDHYVLRQKWLYPYKQIEISYYYDSGGTLTNQVEDTTLFTYDNQNITLPTQTKQSNSDGSVHLSKSLYLNDYQSSDYGLFSEQFNDSAIFNLILNRVLATPLLESRYVDGQLVYQNKLTYNIFSGKALPYKMFEQLPGTSDLLKEVLDSYDGSGNLIQAYRHYDDGSSQPPGPYDPASLHQPISRIFNDDGRFLLAQVQNARTEEIAYTSFEGDGDGNWIDVTSASCEVFGSDAPTGLQYRKFNGGCNGIDFNTMNAADSYVIAFWARAASAGSGRYIFVSSTQSTGPLNDTWTYYEFVVSGVSNVHLYSSGGSGNCYIDELRLFPIDAQMSTICYTDHLQIQCMTDANGKSSYYHYDQFGRLQYVLDQDGNYIQKYSYNYKNP